MSGCRGTQRADRIGHHADDHAEQFRELARTRDRSLRNELIVAHLGLARSLSRRYHGRSESPADLEQVALVGLVKAVERFDPDRGVTFSTFAVPTIVGELKRHFRGQWVVRVPRSLQEQVLELGRAIEDLTGRLGRSPTLTELAHAMGRREDAVLEAMEARFAFTAVTIETPTGESRAEAVTSALIDPEDRLSTVESSIFVQGLLEHLGSRERDIMRLRFFSDLTQSEIAARVGMSQMHVSRLIRQSIDKLRALAGAG
jgi:RNA polymerase sigma-B factor